MGYIVELQTTQTHAIRTLTDTLNSLLTDVNLNFYPYYIDDESESSSEEESSDESSDSEEENNIEVNDTLPEVESLSVNDKGKNTNDRIIKNFGKARPEGYRKAIRLMELANKFNLPVLSFVDTAGAYPGKGAEERGQAQAIASCIDACLKLETPMISTILGEGGSGGAIALTSGNVILMFEHSIFSVISPEGCASILWRDASKANEAAKALKLTAKDMKKLNIIDEIIQEPLEGLIEIMINL